MIKGGYKIIDFEGATLSGTAVEMPGIYDQIVDDYDKPIMVSGVILSGELQDDAYASVKVSDGSVDLTVYGGVITVTEDDEVSFASAKSNTELTEDMTDTQNMIAPEWSATETYTKNAIVRDSGKLYKAKRDVPTGTATSNTTYWTSDVTVSTEFLLLNNKIIEVSLTASAEGYNFTIGNNTRFIMVVNGGTNTLRNIYLISGGSSGSINYVSILDETTISSDIEITTSTNNINIKVSGTARALIYIMTGTVTQLT